MNIKNIKNEFLFQDIFNFLDYRHDLLNKLHIFINAAQDIQNKIKVLQHDLKTIDIDIKKYRKFFKTYDILFYDNNNEIQAIYHVDKIKIFRNDIEKFYDVYYTFIDLKRKEKSNGNVSIRKYLHLLDQPKAKLQLINKHKILLK